MTGQENLPAVVGNFDRLSECNYLAEFALSASPFHIEHTPKFIHVQYSFMHCANSKSYF